MYKCQNLNSDYTLVEKKSKFVQLWNSLAAAVINYET